MTEKQDHNPETIENPDGIPPFNPSVIHPLTLSGLSLKICLQPFDEHIDLDRLADEMAATLCFEDIAFHDTALLMAAQARVLDAAFNRLLTAGFEDMRSPDRGAIRTALMAQRQCVHAVDRVKKYGSHGRKKKTAKRTEG